MRGKGEAVALDELEVIIPNLKKRYSGGTAVNRTIAPLIAETLPYGVARASTGRRVSRGSASAIFCDCASIIQTTRSARIWHARRNTEMLVGLILKRLGWRLKLIFNSAGQRQKTRLHGLPHRAHGRGDRNQCDVGLVRAAGHDRSSITASMSRPTGRRPTGSRPSPRPAFPGSTAIGTFGRVRQQKGVDLFVEAMLRLLPRYPDFTAVVIGFVSVDNRLFVEGLKQRIAAAGLSDRIRFLGELPIAEVPLWYQRISIYVFASRVEGFGLTMLEAMAAGDAVVATRAGAAETIISDGENGVLAPVADVDGLVAALEPLMREPERLAEMGHTARARVVEDFNREREVDEIVAVYRRLWEGEALP